METFKKLTQTEKSMYENDGYVIMRSFYSRQETELLLATYQQDKKLQEGTYGRKDGKGFTTRLALWYSLDASLYSAFARTRRMIDSVRMLLGGEPAHYHSKLMQKDPRVGGAWEWHQDYGYWYHDGFLYPQMLSVMVALTPANVENGCLQVIRGSHLLGRIDHGLTGDQKGADMERVDEALKQMELVYVELEPGDTLFFHANLLHRSDMNHSDTPRCSLISTFNLLTNKPYKPQDASCYTPVDVLPDEKLLDPGFLRGLTEEAHLKR